MSRDGIYRLDTNTFTITSGGQSRPARVVAYVTGGQLFITGYWRQDSTAKYGADGIISSCVIRVPCTIGDHRVVVDTTDKATEDGRPVLRRKYDTAIATLFSALYSGESKDGRVYAIYRSDWNAGAGSVTIESIDRDMLRGSFTMNASNIDNRADTREVRGTFEIPFRRWTDDYYYMLNN